MEKLRPAWAVKAIIVIVITSLLFRCVSSANITVGGPTGWDLLSNIQAWSSTTKFNIGDDLVFTYTPVHDVVEVNQQGYDTCTISNALATYDNGDNTVIHITETGTRYFVCGRLGHCQQGLKLQVQVLAQSNNNDTTDDQVQSRRGAPPRLVPTPNSPPRRPPPPPPPGDVRPPPANQPAPCDCSRAGERRVLVPLITLVIVSSLSLVFLYSSTK